MKLLMYKPDGTPVKNEQTIQAASFVNGILRHKQTNIIVDMIVECIKLEKRITIDEILECWFKTEGRRYVPNYNMDNDKPIEYYAPHEKEKILKYCRGSAENRAKQWFMNNLGAAIIKGKLLVIPIIEV